MSTLKAPELWIMPSGGQWFIAQHGKAGNLGFFASLDEAIRHAREIGKASAAAIFIREGSGWRREDAAAAVNPQPSVGKSPAVPPPARPESSSHMEIWVYEISAEKWGIKLPLGTTPFAIHNSKGKAVTFGKTLSVDTGFDLVVFGADGHVESRSRSGR